MGFVKGGERASRDGVELQTLQEGTKTKIIVGGVVWVFNENGYLQDPIPEPLTKTEEWAPLPGEDDEE